MQQVNAKATVTEGSASKKAKEYQHQPDLETKERSLPSILTRLNLGKEWEAAEERGYELLQKLGSGSFGTVVKARSRESNQTVAIKMMTIDFSSKYKVILAYRELAILEFLTKASNNQNEIRFFPAYQSVFTTEKEIGASQF